MDFLNQAFAQISDMFRSMTPGARLTAGLLLVMVVVSLGYLFTQQVSGTDVYLMNGAPIPASQQAAMEAAFAKAGLNTYEFEGSRIRVPAGQKAAYMGALADAKALPPDFGSYITDAIENTGQFSSSRQDEQRMNAAKQKELAQILCSMRGIENAAVLFDCERRRGLNAENLKTASVSVKPLGSEELTSQQVSKIRYTVAFAYAGLKPENVTVTDLNGRTYPGGEDIAGTGPESDRLGQAKQREEALWKSKIENLLSYVQGAIVTTYVELDNKRVSHTDKITYGDDGAKPIPIMSKEESDSRSSEGAPPAGPPGLKAQGANGPATLAMSRKGSSKSEDKSKSEQGSVINTKHEVTEEFPFTTKLVKVSVALPSSYLAGIWKQRNPTEEGAEPAEPDQAALDTIRDEEVTRITDLVGALLPKPTAGAATAKDLVAVSVFQNIAGEPIPEPGMAQNAMAWFAKSWSMLVMVGLAGFSLLMLRSMVRGTVVAPTPNAPEAATAEGETPVDESESPPAARLARFSGSGPSLRDELSELVHEDPDSAANILRTWIGQTG